jgi:hypothetical protein
MDRLMDFLPLWKSRFVAKPSVPEGVEIKDAIAPARSTTVEIKVP